MALLSHHPGEEKLMKKAFVLAVALMVMASRVHAAYDLRITEIWPGNTGSENLTDDWFELTNYGNMAWVAAVDGDLYFDDDSFDPSTADLMSGVPSIAPGESVVFVDGSAATGGLNTAIWSSVWSPVVNPLPQIGTYEGAGLGQGGDAIGLWISFGPPVGAPSITGSYPNASMSGGGSYDLVLGEFSTVGNAAGAVATTELNANNEPAIGSPGSTAIPEPATFALLALSMVLISAKRR
jgi:hypothetical protein